MEGTAVKLNSYFSKNQSKQPSRTPGTPQSTSFHETSRIKSPWGRRLKVISCNFCVSISPTLKWEVPGYFGLHSLYIQGNGPASFARRHEVYWSSRHDFPVLIVFFLSVFCQQHTKIAKNKSTEGHRRFAVGRIITVRLIRKHSYDRRTKHKPCTAVLSRAGAMNNTWYLMQHSRRLLKAQHG